MAFPTTSRIAFSNNPLKEVICQLRFPKILRIASEVPSAFQDRVRTSHPEYSDKPQKNLPEGMPAELAKLFSGISEESPEHSFINSDGTSKITLASEFLAITTTSYSGWEQFWSILEPAVQALQDIYQPTYFKRIGLRYINAMQWKKPEEEADPGPLLNFVNPVLLGPLTDEIVGPAVQSHEAQFVVALKEGGFARVRYISDNSKAQSFDLDSDFFTESSKIDWDETSRLLKHFNCAAGNLFRWSVKPYIDAAKKQPDEL